VTRLRSYGGDSAYVPTTTISSSTDDIVQPQYGTGASAYINDARGVGVSNSEVQTVCAEKPAGGFYTHEGILYHPLAYALAVDALTHAGPGKTSRIDISSVCNEIVAPGWSLDDVLDTEGELCESLVGSRIIITLVRDYSGCCRCVIAVRAEENHGATGNELRYVLRYREVMHIALFPSLTHVVSIVNSRCFHGFFGHVSS
jgi:hypothetical protein